MRYHLTAPNALNTNIILPSSKSISNRVLLLNALSGNPKKINNISVCDDTDVMITALKSSSHDINIKAAGTAMRFLTAYYSCKAGSRTITGTQRMKNRPIKLLVEALRNTGANIDYLENEGFPPLHIRGHELKGGDIILRGDVSSQFISAMLIIAPTMNLGLRMKIEGLIISRPYLQLTIKLMKQYGVTVYEENQTYTVPPQQYKPVDGFTVESDWSAASYWYQMMAICKDRSSSITLEGLYPGSIQGDSAIIRLFEKLGVKTTFSSGGVSLSKTDFTIKEPMIQDFVSIPDMAQTFVVTCAMLNIPFTFTGLQSLKVKETDRLAALKNELAKFGYPLTIINDDTIEWKGDRCEKAVIQDVFTYEDHRMAMAFAPIAFNAGKGVSIINPEVVTKSYPTFWEDLKKAGFEIQIKN
jgi:3-phosphoshikimate 1-carboxyvinyltransferase